MTNFHPSMKNAFWAPQALVWKRNCTELHYYEDDYIKYFCPKTSQKPISSLNMCMRVVGIRKIVEKFMESFKNEKVQFVNLGAGLDTVSFWVMNKFPNSVCYDSDLEYQVKLKVDILLNTKELLQMFPSHQATESTFSSPRYKLFPCDLTKVDELNKLKDFGFSDQLPTVYLSEFVFMFIPNNTSNEIIKLLQDFSKGPSVVINQELGNPSCCYMKWYSTFNANTAPSLSLHVYPTKESQVMRYKSLGWEHVFVHDLTFVYNQMLDKSERLRLRNIENFNDLESLGISISQTFTSTVVKNSPQLTNFLNYLNHKEYREFDKDDELLPTFTEEELQKEMPMDNIKRQVAYLFDVTFSADTEECKSFYNKFV